MTDINDFVEEFWKISSREVVRDIPFTDMYHFKKNLEVCFNCCCCCCVNVANKNQQILEIQWRWDHCREAAEPEHLQSHVYDGFKRMYSYLYKKQDSCRMSVAG